MSKILIIIMLILSCVSPLSGQEILSLDRCRDLVLKHNEALQQAANQVELARQQQAAARTFRLPSFSATATGIWQDKDLEMELILPTMKPNPITGELEPNLMINPATGLPLTGADGNPVFNMYAWMPLEVSLSGAYMAGFQMEQPIYAGGKVAAGNKMADIGLEMAGDNMALQRMNYLLAADHAYWTYVSLIQKVTLAQQSVELLEEVMALAGNSQEVGMSSRNDLLKAQVAFNEAKLALKKAGNGLTLSRLELCRLTGLPWHSDILPSDTHIVLLPVNDDDITTKGPDRRPDYRLLEKKVSMEDQQIRLTRADFLPQAGFQAGYQHLGGIKFSGTSFDNTSLNLLVSVKIPIFHWGEGFRKVTMAKIEKENSLLELARYRQLMHLEAEQARMNLELARERILLNEAALLQAEENLRVSRDNYEVRIETMTALLAAQTQWQQAYTELIEARTDYRIRESQWRKANGILGQ